MREVKASTILDDAYRLIGWDATQMDDRDKTDARSALSNALQEVVEAWWWPEWMQCQRVQFFEDWDDDFSPVDEGSVYYDTEAEAYYLAEDDGIDGPPTDPDTGEVNEGWVKLEPDTEYELESGETYEWNPQVPIERDGTQMGPWGAVRIVSEFDPRLKKHMPPYDTEPVEDGERIVGLTVARPWVWSRRVTPILTGDQYDAEETYEAVTSKDRVWVGSVAAVLAELGLSAWLRQYEGRQQILQDGYWYDFDLVDDEGVITIEIGQTGYP